MSKKAMWLQTIIFLAFIGAFFVLNLAIPDKERSEQENRYLQMLPEFSFKDLFDGDFTSDFEDYVTDQFAFRDSWTALKARCELLIGKDENKGIYLCEGETLIDAFEAPEKADIEPKLEAVNMLCESRDIPVYFGLIPSSAEIWADMLPKGAPNDSQKDFIDFAYDAVSSQTVDFYSALSAHAKESIYYRTDHHWTTLGAYYGYTALANAMGFEPLPLENYTEKVISESFLGTTYSSSGYGWVKPESISTYVEQGNAVITNYPSGTPTEGSLYVESFLEVKDKYSYFYGGNTPLLTVETGNEGPSLLIVRDSYMDSLSPYLFPHFSEIHIVDLRHYRLSLASYIDANDIDNILICYSVANFATDDNVFTLAY